MSQEETAEIESHIRRARRPTGLLIFTAVWMLFMAIGLVMYGVEGKHGQWSGRDHVRTVIVGVLFAISLYRYIRSFRIARRMRRDAQKSVLRIVKPKKGPASDNGKDPSIIIEYLPHSHLIWSIDGLPDSWRLRRIHASKNRPTPAR